MATRTGLGIDEASPPFDQLTSIQRLAAARSGHHSPEHARYQLYVAREKRNPVNVLIKVTSKPGQVYEQNLNNEICSLSTINRELPDSAVFSRDPSTRTAVRWTPLPEHVAIRRVSAGDDNRLGTSSGQTCGAPEARDRDRQGIDRHPSPGDLPCRSESDECPVPGNPRQARDQDRRLRVVVRACTPFERRLL